MAIIHKQSFAQKVRDRWRRGGSVDDILKLIENTDDTSVRYDWGVQYNDFRLPVFVCPCCNASALRQSKYCPDCGAPMNANN